MVEVEGVTQETSVRAPLLPPGVTSSPTPLLLTLVNPSISHSTATPIWLSPLKDVVCVRGDEQLGSEGG